MADTGGDTSHSFPIINFGSYKERYDQTGDHLGSGGYGDVYKVKRKIDNKMYALKVVKSVHLSEILSEIWIPCTFSHPHINKVHEIFLDMPIQENSKHRDNEYVWKVVMVSDIGTTLYDVINKLTPNADTTKKITKWLLEIIDVLDFLQRNDVIYGDIKPDNFLIGNNGSIKLIDYGMHYKIGYGDAPVTQSYGDMGSIGKQCMQSITPEEGERIRTPDRIVYDAKNSAMWALAVTILYMLGVTSDYSATVKGDYGYKVPTFVKKMSNNPTMVYKLVKGGISNHQQWADLVFELISNPPSKFSDIYSMLPLSMSPYVMKEGINRMPELPSRDRVNENINVKNMAVNILYGSTFMDIPIASKIMALEYFSRFMTKIGMNIDLTYGQILDQHTISYNSSIRTVDFQWWNPNKLQKIGEPLDRLKYRFPNNTSKNPMKYGLPVFMFASIVLGQAAVSNEYEILSMNGIMKLIDKRFSPSNERFRQLSESERMMYMKGIVHYIYGIIKATGGSYLIPNPYFHYHHVRRQYPTVDDLKGIVTNGNYTETTEYFDRMFMTKISPS